MYAKQILVALLAAGSVQALTVRAPSCTALGCVESCLASGSLGGACVGQSEASPEGNCQCASTLPEPVPAACKPVECVAGCIKAGSLGGVCLPATADKPAGECRCASHFGTESKRDCNLAECGRQCARHGLKPNCQNGVCLCHY